MLNGAEDDDDDDNNNNNNNFTYPDKRPVSQLKRLIDWY